MTLQGHTSSQGKVPRYFALDPSAKWMVVANQGSDSVVVFAVDQNSGELKAAGPGVTLAKPGGIAFLGR